MKFFEKIKIFIPNVPRKRFGVYCGTNTSKEIWIILKSIIKIIFFNKKTNKLTKKFEKKFSQITKQKYCLSYGSGRMALYSILKSMNIKKNDQIIVPAFTCTVVPNAIIYSGAIPKYVDIDISNFNINYNLIEKHITTKTVAIYVQHTFGIECKMKKIIQLAKKYNLKIIEDNAHYFNFKKKINPSIYASFYSLDHSKIINTHLGGVATTNKIEVYNKLKNHHKNLYELGRVDQIRMLFSFLIELIILNPYLLWFGNSLLLFLNYFKITFYFRDELSRKKPKYYPCKYNEYLAEIAINQIKNIKKNLSHRKKIANFLEKKIKWYKLKNNQISEHSWLRYSFLTNNRKNFIKPFNKYFNLDIWYSSIFEGRSRNYNEIKYIIGSCPTAEYVSNHIVNFPTHLKIPADIYKNIFAKYWNSLKYEIPRKKIKINKEKK